MGKFGEQRMNSRLGQPRIAVFDPGRRFRYSVSLKNGGLNVACYGNQVNKRGHRQRNMVIPGAVCITAGASSAVHINSGDGTSFSIATNTVPGLSSYPAWDCVVADVDNNGRLDLLLVHAENFHNTGPFPCKFYLQTSPGVFVQQTGYEFTDSNDPYTIPIWTDYDLDGDLDLFIGSGPGGSTGPDYRYKNLLKETGAFSLQRITAAPFNLLEDGQVYNFIDYDNDGDMDGMLTLRKKSLLLIYIPTRRQTISVWTEGLLISRYKSWGYWIIRGKK